MKNKTLRVVTAAVAGSSLLATLVGVGVVSAAEPTVTDRPVRFTLSDDQRATLDQAKTLREQGKFDEAKTLLESSGLFKRLPRMLARHHDAFQEQREDMKEHRAAIEQALKNKDFAAFKELTKQAPFADKLDEALFAKLVEAHTLRANGDVEGAKKIMKEILPMHVFPHEGAFKHGLRLMKGATPQTP